MSLKKYCKKSIEPSCTRQTITYEYDDTIFRMLPHLILQEEVFRIIKPVNMIEYNRYTV